MSIYPEAEKTENSKEPTTFERVAQTIHEIAIQAPQSYTTYTDDQIYVHAFDDITIAVNESFSYVRGDQGSWSGVEISYVNPEGVKLRDRLIFREDIANPQIEIGSGPRRAATEDDMKEFESFLAHINHAIEATAREEQLKKEKEQAEQALRGLARTVYEYRVAANKLQMKKTRLMSNSAELANAIDGLSEEEALGLLVNSWSGEAYSPYEAAWIMEEVRQVIKDILESNPTSTE